MLHVFFAVTCVLALIWWYKNYTQPKGFPNGPSFALPFIGHGYRLGNSIIKSYHRFRGEYGDIFGLFLGSSRTIILNDFDSIQESGFHEDFMDRPKFLAGLKGTLSDGGEPGVIFSNGKQWSEQRRFALRTLRDFGFGKQKMEEIIDDQVSQLCSILESKQGQPMSVFGVFNVSVLNGLWSITTGQSLSQDDPKIQRINQLFNESDESSASLMFLFAILFPNLEKLLSKTGLWSMKFKTAMEEIGKVCKQPIREHEETFDPNNLRDFIDTHIQEQQNPESGISFHGQDGKLNLQVVTEDLFAAGSSTVSMTLTWAVLFLANYPDIQTKIQNEIKAVTGGNRVPTNSERQNMPFTEATIHEIQRLANIVPNSVPREATKDTYFRGYFIPKGTQIFPNLGEVLMDPKHFSNPSKFDPSRYINESGKFVPSPYVIPFGLGKRRCLGETLARVELFKFFTGLVDHFKMKGPVMHLSARNVHYIHPIDPFHLKFALYRIQTDNLKAFGKF
uniref:Cytochrome P450 CYP3032C1 n=1 Tax=Tigriopus japonicus TaxID=158387 RepID=A0A088DKQ3_TIGJA|nr:cytochrome P450 CYP3032C1 [Tigriopus japonicus]